MSDRMDAVLANIDTALDGCDDDWTVSGDAMRWCPPGQQQPEEPVEWPPDSFGADLQRLSEATQAMARAVTEPFSRITAAITVGLDRAENMRNLEIVVPDLEERSAYLYVCDNSPGIALEYAQAGIPVELIRDLRASGVTTVQFALLLNTPEPPPTGEEFRRRALEARQNRGTGPQRRDNRRWRNT